MAKENDEPKGNKTMIMINKMYTGSYLNSNDGNNIGHEIVNFFEADDKNKYIYITPYGKFNLDYKDYIRYVLFTDATIDGKYNIIAKAEVDSCKIEKNKNKYEYILREEYKEIHNKQAKEIKYGGKRLYDIYKDNVNNDQAIYVTFKIKEIKKAKKKIEVNLKDKEKNEEIKTTISGDNKKIDSFKKSEIKEGKTPLKIGQSNYIYLNFDENCDNKKPAKCLIDIIKDKENQYWKEDNSIDRIEINDNKIESDSEKFNFLNLIGKEYDENIFTNMFAFYFNIKYKDKNNKETIILNKFLKWLEENGKINKKSAVDLEFKEILKEFSITVKNTNKSRKNECNDEEIENEEENILRGRMDLFASKDSKYLVIENKIKSRINGKKEEGFQLELYKNLIKKKYTEFNEENLIGIVLVPNYNEETIKNEKGYDNVKENYNIVKYSDIYQFFSDEIKKENIKDTNAQKYFDDFKSALFIQTLNSKEREEYKFKKAIYNIPRNIKYTVYVTRFKGVEKDFKYYVGTTNNLDRRENELSEVNKFKGYKKDKTIWSKEYENFENAINMEEILEKEINENIENTKESYLDKKHIEEIEKNIEE